MHPDDIDHLRRVDPNCRPAYNCTALLDGRRWDVDANCDDTRPNAYPCTWPEQRDCAAADLDPGDRCALPDDWPGATACAGDLCRWVYM